MLVDPVVVFLQRSSLFFVVVVAQVKVTKSRGRMAAKVEGILCSTVAEVKVVWLLRAFSVVPLQRSFSVAPLQRSRSGGCQGQGHSL